MIRSMTGYGKAVLETPQRKITVEIRTLNSKQADISTRLPLICRDKDLEVRNLLIKRLERGKMDLTITFDAMEGEAAPLINKNIVKGYFSQLRELSGELGISDDARLLAAALRLPETMSTERAAMSDQEWSAVTGLIEQAVTLTDNYRLEEGSAMENDLEKSVTAILTSLESLEGLEGERLERMREKLRSLLEESAGTENVDRNRFEQELIFYLEKLDINEEKVRLKKHCDYFTETMKSNGLHGRMLNFISQEMGREINTIGSKANDAGMQKLVVMMKDELEKIKELTLNIL